MTHRRWLEDKGVALGEHAWGQVLAGFAPASGHSSIELRYGPATVSPGAPEEAAAALPLSHAQALRLAQQVFGEGLVVVEADTVERAWGWVFSATSATHASSGRDEDALIGLGCVLVDRRDGSVHTFGSSGPPGYWADEYERRRDGSWLSRLLRRLRGR